MVIHVVAACDRARRVKHEEPAPTADTSPQNDRVGNTVMRSLRTSRRWIAGRRPQSLT
jgi:hypothetical protein